MPSISNMGQSLHMRSLLASVREKIGSTQEQTITGMKSGSFGGLGTAALGSLSLRGQLASIDAYKAGIEQVIPRTQVMNDSMLKIAQVARDMVAEAAKYPRNDAVPVSLVNEMARNAMGIVQQQLNSQIGGRYLFAGTDVGTGPMADPQAIGTSLQPFLADFAAGNIDADAVLAGVNGITGTAAGYSAALGTTGAVTVRADENYDIDYTILADAPGFQDVMRGLSILQNIELTPGNREEFWNLVDRATALIDKGARGVDHESAKLGAKMKIMDDVLVRHEQSAGIAQRFLGNIEEVDIADAITRLQTLQTQLQAAYETMGMLRQMSLVNYLR